MPTAAEAAHDKVVELTLHRTFNQNLATGRASEVQRPIPSERWLSIRRDNRPLPHCLAGNGLKQDQLVHCSEPIGVAPSPSAPRRTMRR